MLMAYGINQLLMTHYELPRLPAYYLPIGAVALWLTRRQGAGKPAPNTHQPLIDRTHDR